jgi:hypothetical protein
MYKFNSLVFTVVEVYRYSKCVISVVQSLTGIQLAMGVLHQMLNVDL